MKNQAQDQNSKESIKASNKAQTDAIKNNIGARLVRKLNGATGRNHSGEVSGQPKKHANVLGKKKAIPKFMTKKEREAFEAQRKLEQQAKERLKRLERLYQEIEEMQQYVE